MAELTATCALEIDKLDPQGEAPVFGSALAAITAEMKPAHREANIEDILSGVQRKIEAIVDSKYPHLDQKSRHRPPRFAGSSPPRPTTL